jgi:serine/threonine protein kinase
MKQMRLAYMKKVNKDVFLNAMHERDIHKSLSHPNIVRLLEVIEDEQDDDKMYMILEFASRGTINWFDEADTKMFWPQGLVGHFLAENHIRKYCQ